MVKLLQILWSLFSKSSSPSAEAAKPTELIKTEEVKVPAQKPAKHVNDGKCPKCELIFTKYPGFHQGLKDWFLQIQTNHPDAHISAAGRGKLEQEEYFKKKTSKAHYGQSAHNAGLALDIFKLHGMGAEWPNDWFQAVIKPAVDSHNAVASFKINWYGAPGSEFYELPHCQVQNWKELVKNGKAKLVE